MDFKLTRIAPTPSGFLHLGNAYSFLVTKALAEKHEAKILLRIDDLDRERYRTESVTDIFESLDFLEIPIDQGPKNPAEFEKEWSQIHRMSLYEAALENVRNSGKVFACDCSRKQIQQMDPRGYYLGYCLDRRQKLHKPDFCWRINTFESDFLELRKYPDQYTKELIPEETAFYMVRKKDGLPSYHLTSVVDDLEFGVDLIIRGQDLYPSSIAQLDLSKILGGERFTSITMHHHPILKGPEREKLSKSSGSMSLQYLRKEGKTLAEIYNQIGRMAGLGDQIRTWDDFRKALKF